MKAQRARADAGFILIDAVAASVILALVGAVILGIYLSVGQQLSQDATMTWRVTNLKAVAVELARRGLGRGDPLPSFSASTLQIELSELVDDTLPKTFRHVTISAKSDSATADGSRIELLVPVHR